MERKRISSSRIRSAGYDDKTRTLEIEFSDGRISAYMDVAPDIYRGLMSAPSPVAYFEDRIAEDYTASRIK